MVGAHGLRGEVRVLPHTDFPEQLAQRRELWLEHRGRGRLCPVERGRWHPAKGEVLLKLAGYDDRTAAEALQGAALKIRPSDAVKLPEGEYYHWEIIGLEVVTTSGRYVGHVSDIMRTGANDVYVVSPADGAKEALIPAVADVITEVNREAGRIVIEPMPGLLE